MRRRDPRDELEDFRPDAPAGLFLSRKGNWFHDGQRVGHERLEALLHGSIARDAAGSLIVTTGRDVLAFVAEDAPFAVVAVDGDVAVLDDGSREAVGDVVVGPDDRWRMRVKGGAFWALLSKSAAQTLERALSDDGAALVLGARRVPVTTTQKSSWSD